MNLIRTIARAGGVALAALLALGCSTSDTKLTGTVGGPQFHHVLLISIDGMHTVDLDTFVKSNPTSNLAMLAGMGAVYSNVQTPVPSDSFPGLLALTTGGTPNSTGVWYDASFNRDLLPPTGYAGRGIGSPATPGTLVFYDESLDLNFNDPLWGLPGGPTPGPLTNHGAASIDPTALPLDPTTKAPIYPHSYLRVNTVFEVIKGAGLHTAWCDKHAAYDLVNGPSGTGVDDLFTPEINSPVTNNPTADWTKAVLDTVYYDGLKVAAVVNEINGLDHTGTTKVGVPAILGMNFQAVSVGQKLKGGGYYDAKGTPTDTLKKGLAGVDAGIGLMIKALQGAGLWNDTVIIISAKHGQSPIDPTRLVRFDDSLTGTNLDPTNPNATAVTNFLFSQGITAYTNANDTCYFLWLKDQSDSNVAAAVSALQGADPAVVGPISSILSGASLKAIFNDPTVDHRVPDLIVLPPAGTVYTGGSKIAEHGGFNADDRAVCLLVAHGLMAASKVSTPVKTTQVAPTILKALGIDPGQLQAVAAEKTAVLPGLDF